MLFINKNTIAALFLGVSMLLISSCESNVPSHSANKSEILQESVENFSNSTDERPPLRDPGKVDTTNLTELTQEMLRGFGIDPDEIRFGELSDKGFVLRGEEAWKRYMKDWDPKNGFGNIDHSLASQSAVSFSSSASPTSAQTAFEVQDISNPPANGSITVTYEGEQVTSNYSQYQSASTVAYSLASDINNDPDIELTATVPSSGIVMLTEKRTGCAYNDNTAYVSHSQGTHITVNNSTFTMTGGADVEGCDTGQPPPPPPPPPPPLYISFGSVIDTPCCGASYGVVDMFAYSWASDPIDYIDVAAVSVRDFTVLASGQSGGNNQANAILGTSEYKYPSDPVSEWTQTGDHQFIDGSYLDYRVLTGYQVDF